MGATAHSDFGHFAAFPSEIRELIWEECPPHRVVEIDPPSSESQISEIVPDELESEPFCSWTATSSRQWEAYNCSPPVIAGVCRESRRVALRNGGWLQIGHYKAVWLNPIRDVLHLNWHQYVDDFNYPYSRGIIALVAGARASRVSITYNLIVGDSAPPSTCNPAVGDVVDDEVPIPDQLEQRQSYEVCLGTVIIHVTGTKQERRDRIIESGLFGLFCEKQAEPVGATDHAKLQEYARFNSESGPPQDVRATYFFQNSQAVSVQEHMREVDVAWLKHRWEEAEKNAMVIEDRQTVWGPDPETPYREVPNRDHPWVRNVLRAMPSSHPVYMIRLCTRECV